KQDIKDDDYDYLILISEIISKVLAQKQFYSNISNVLDEEILYHLLENNIKNKSIIKERLKSNSLVLSVSIEVMVVDISNFKLKKSAYSEELKLGLFNLFPMSESVYYNGNIVIINDKGSEQISQIRNNDKMVKKFLLENNLKMGISNEFSSIEECSVYYNQAVMSLEIGKVI